MRYNEDSYRYVYDRNQILSLADTDSISAQKRQQTIDYFKNRQTDVKVTSPLMTIVKEQKNGLFTSTVYTSPLFEMDINGEKFAAFYDHLTEGRNSRTAIGETVTLHVSSKEPRYIMAPVFRRVIWKFAGAAVLIAIGAFLIISVLNGHVEGSALHW